MHRPTPGNESALAEYQRLLEVGKRADGFAQRIANVSVTEQGCVFEARRHIAKMLSLCDDQKGLMALDYADALGRLNSAIDNKMLGL